VIKPPINFDSGDSGALCVSVAPRNPMRVHLEKIRRAVVVDHALHAIEKCQVRADIEFLHLAARPQQRDEMFRPPSCPTLRYGPRRGCTPSHAARSQRIAALQSVILGRKHRVLAEP
jgi:hypothetical protein